MKIYLNIALSGPGRRRLEDRASQAAYVRIEQLRDEHISIEIAVMREARGAYGISRTFGDSSSMLSPFAIYDLVFGA